MSITSLRTEYRTARKDYACHACLWLREGSVFKGTGTGLTFAELRQVAIAKKHKWKILKGQKHEVQYNIQDGEFYTFRAIPEMANICRKLDLFTDC